MVPGCLGHERTHGHQNACWSRRQCLELERLGASGLGAGAPSVARAAPVALDFWSGWVDWPARFAAQLGGSMWPSPETTLVGFALGTALGFVLAVLIVHSRTLEKALLPWIVASQSIPVLAIAHRAGDSWQPGAGRPWRQGRDCHVPELSSHRGHGAGLLRSPQVIGPR